MHYSLKNRSGGGMLWLFQRLSGLVLVGILLTHFFLLHFTVEGHSLTFDQIYKRLTTHSWKTLDLIFLYLALFHGLNGIWTVIADYINKGWMKISAFCLIILAGLWLSVYGSLTILNFPRTLY
jgi:succinate dehydrogenase / fumarate reductase, membrane anchor subunit